MLALNTKAQSSLWPYGISGDLPIVLVRVSADEDMDMVRQLLRGHEYLRLKGLTIDLVILNDHPPSYLQALQDELQMLIRTSGRKRCRTNPAASYLRRADIMPEADRILLHAVARVVIVTERGTLEEQLVRRPIEEPSCPRPFAPRAAVAHLPEPTVETPDLSFFNGLGGFQRRAGASTSPSWARGSGRPRRGRTSSPTSSDFGFQVTETGGGYTWSVNSRENRLTPWSNDAVSDPPGEVDLLARRRDRDGLDADAAARPRSASPTSSGTGRATRSSSTRATASRRSCCLRAAGRAGEDLGAASA